MTTMASIRESPHIEETGVRAESPGNNRSMTGGLKRKASFDYDSTDEDSPKRARHDENWERRRDRSPSPYSKRRGSSLEKQSLPYDEPIRRPSATVEDKKRGKRLFGGLLSTLSQTNANSQQKRRQEIEKRQQERLQKQKAEDDQRRQENVERLTHIRMEGQMDFEERVMLNKHSKLRWTAKHLKTKAEPPIYYLPWRLTREQADTIKDQKADAKEIIENDRQAFRIRQRKHAEQYGHRKLSSPPQTETATSSRDMKALGEGSDSRSADDAKPLTKAERDHDDNNELVVMDEDTVIY